MRVIQGQTKQEFTDISSGGDDFILAYGEGNSVLTMKGMYGGHKRLMIGLSKKLTDEY